MTTNLRALADLHRDPADPAVAGLGGVRRGPPDPANGSSANEIRRHNPRGRRAFRPRDPRGDGIAHVRVERPCALGSGYPRPGPRRGPPRAAIEGGPGMYYTRRA